MPVVVSALLTVCVATIPFSNWWKPAVRPLDRIKAGEVSAEDAGLNHKQGGGGGWWQPLAMLYVGDPKKASAVAGDMCRIWKAPLVNSSPYTRERRA